MFGKIIEVKGPVIDVIFEDDYCMIYAIRIELNKSWVD